ncbi:MAG: MarR family transcriptional regulator [Clostridiales bacterium]|nr:MarR family transcriptional regulator [Clostridiales bacterium]
MQLAEFRNGVITTMRSCKVSYEKLAALVLEGEGVTYLQAMILYGIYDGLVTNVSSVSRLFCTEQANASAMCKKLERDGLIVRNRRKDDERVVSLLLTENGRTVLHNLEVKLHKWDSFLESLMPQTLETILAGLTEGERVIRGLTEIQLRE